VNILPDVAELARIEGPVILAIGVFDGVHLGHRAVIERALNDARTLHGSAVIVTFDPHPVRVLRPAEAPRLLTSTRHKIRLIRELGARHLLIIPFNEQFATTPAERFIETLAATCRPLREICVGHQWSFGKGRSGNLDLLKRLGDTLGFDEVGVHAVQVDGQIVSSTLIRNAVARGDLATAQRLLGRPFTVLGTVVRGDGRGRTLGFPTANLNTGNEQFPPDGVYAATVTRRSEKLRAVANIGVRPTVAEAARTRLLEAHLLDFHGDLYDEEIELSFDRYLRAEKRFAGLEELRQQIARDVALAKEMSSPV
jgi:riboflavin kinase/FMN adenylyltransferase